MTSSATYSDVMRLPRLPPSLSRVEGHPAYRVLGVLGTAMSAGTILAAVVSAFTHMSTNALIALAVGTMGALGIPLLAYVISRPQPVSIVPGPCYYQGAPSAKPPSVGISGSAIVTNHTGRPLHVVEARLRSRGRKSATVSLHEVGLRGEARTRVDDGETLQLQCWFNEPLPGCELIGMGSFGDVLELRDQDDRIHSAPVTFEEVPLVRQVPATDN
jgi:hypothetical protein